MSGILLWVGVCLVHLMDFLAEIGFFFLVDPLVKAHFYSSEPQAQDEHCTFSDAIGMIAIAESPTPIATTTWRCCDRHHFTSSLLETLAFSTPQSEVAQEASTDVVAFSTPTSEVARHIHYVCPLRTISRPGSLLAAHRACGDRLCLRHGINLVG